MKHKLIRKEKKIINGTTFLSSAEVSMEKFVTSALQEASILVLRFYEVPAVPAGRDQSQSNITKTHSFVL